MSAPWVVAFCVLAGAVVILALLVAGLMRRVAYVLEQAEAHVAGAATLAPGPGGAPPGTHVADAAGVRTDGHEFATSELEGRRSVVLFLSGTCLPCKSIARDLRRNLARQPLAAELIVVLHDEAERAELELGGVDVVYQPDSALSRAFQTATTPHAFVVDETRTILMSATPNTVAALHELVARSGLGEGAPQPLSVNTT